MREYLAGQQEQQQLQAAQDHDINYLDHTFGQIEQQIGRELTENEVRLLTGAALVNRDEHGFPNVQAAWELAQQIEQDNQKRWATTKRAPHMSATGEQATHVPSLDTLEQRADYARQRVAQLEAEEQAGS